MNKGTAIIGISMLLALIVVAGANGSGFGEYASPGGRLNFTVQLNHTGVQQWTLWNGDNYTLGFYVVPPPFNGTPNSPTVKFSTMNGMIPPSSSYTINITVIISPTTTINKTWTGYAEAVSYIPNQSSSGASVNVGTDKLMQVNSVPSTTSTTSTSTTSTSTATTIYQSPPPGDKIPSSTTSTTTTTTSTIDCKAQPKLCINGTSSIPTSTTVPTSNTKYQNTTPTIKNNTNGTTIPLIQTPQAGSGIVIIAIIIGVVILVSVVGFFMLKQGVI